MLMFAASADSHVKKQPTAANAENVARGAVCTPVLARIPIAERRETLDCVGFARSAAGAKHARIRLTAKVGIAVERRGD